MLFALVKTIHLLMALLLIGSLACCLYYRKRLISKSVLLVMLMIAFLALLTGSLLVPEHFSYQTPWIKAAYIFITIIMIGIGLMRYIKRRALLYVLLMFILTMIVHDAVTKTTWLFT